MENPIPITSTNIAANFVTCTVCEKVWRTIYNARCPRCDQEYGTPFQLNPLAQADLMDAMADFGNEEEYKDEDDIMRLALVMEDPLSDRQRILARFHRAMDHCQWFNYEDPWYSQACWMVLREYADPTPYIQRAMEILEAQFQERVVLVDERGDIMPPLVDGDGNLLVEDPLMVEAQARASHTHPSPVDLHMG